jgi:hypothetical protein
MSAPNLGTEVGLADQVAPDALVPPDGATRDASVGVGHADGQPGIPLEAGGLGFPVDPNNSVGLRAAKRMGHLRFSGLPIQDA